MRLSNKLMQQVSKARKFIKRATSKKARLEGKRYGENVSPRIKGYAD